MLTNNLRRMDLTGKSLTPTGGVNRIEVTDSMLPLVPSRLSPLSVRPGG